MIIFWIIVFIVTLSIMIKGADWLLESAERIGLAVGLSPFIVGAVIVGAGTSFPELIASLSALMQGVTEIITANAVGSNITNILLVIGLSAIFGRKLMVSKNLIDLDLPLLAVGSVLVLGVLWDQTVNTGEAILLVISYLIYIFYTILHHDEEPDEFKLLPSRRERRRHIVKKIQKPVKRPKLRGMDLVKLISGITGLFIGAMYMVESVIKISDILEISPAIISITVVAIGTSLPELIVSIQAARKGKAEVAVGNIFGSNAFNALIVIGFPALFSNLAVDQQTFAIGLPTMAMATLLFIISGISKKIHAWEGAMYLMVYILFISKLFNLF